MTNHVNNNTSHQHAVLYAAMNLLADGHIACPDYALHGAHFYCGCPLSKAMKTVRNEMEKIEQAEGFGPGHARNWCQKCSDLGNDAYSDGPCPRHQGKL